MYSIYLCNIIMVVQNTIYSIPSLYYQDECLEMNIFMHNKYMQQAMQYNNTRIVQFFLRYVISNKEQKLFNCYLVFSFCDPNFPRYVEYTRSLLPHIDQSIPFQIPYKGLYYPANLSWNGYHWWPEIPS